ncbi:hypothetical protein I316_00030 [Kwoniella heveanensis BCC8398]|uniref:Uncharacterized protein n=1 Tax=Kwoniella heveanensis BCC8398 TaxID=1296120 RepID=A0A1B9H3G4_9TREE|nr:hypothetical protein I316_00030 [Kwoniella heveanensis BCC8398]
MSADVETPITLPAFPRPTSLYLPDVPRSVPILDTTSYSPFPTFPGSNHRARDPYGLNAYLLHPDDNLWHYVDPMPNPSALGAVQHQRSSSMDEQSSPSITPVRAVKKQRSLSGLRPSPLSQPPVSGEKADDSESDNKPEMLQRRRSSSLSSSPRLSLEQEVEIVATFRSETAKTPKTPKSGKKSLRRAFTKARKSVFGTSDTPPVPSMPALPEPRALLAPSMSGSSSESTTDPTTPMTSRSNSNYSSVSSASSTSSSEGVKTPGEGVSAEIAITGSKLADALQEAGEKKNKGKGWKWLGARKGGKLTVKDSDGSGSTTPLSDLSAASTPNSSTPDLLAGGVPKVTLTPSPAITTPRGGSPVLAPSEQMARQHTWASEQLRRVSMRKLGQLRSPSPHPLALSLRRQNSKLPDEVAFSIQSGQRVFPMSVNSHQGAEGDLVPAQGGLWLNIAISRVMQKLEQGEQPDGILKARPSPKKKSTIPRPRGVLDFINRPPYEERNIVFYPDNVFSPISMARPGYGVWDLDFSPYIFALSTIDDSGSTWPAMPRASLETPSDELAEVIKAFGESSMEDEKVETLKSPAPLREQGPDAAFTTLTASAPLKTSTPLASRVLTPAQSPSKSRPLSSFRSAGRHSNTSSASASSSSSGESESEEEDDEPLAVVAKRRSQSFQSQPRPVGTVPLHPAAASSSTGRPSAGVAAGRSLSQPDKRASKRLSLPLEADSSRWKEMQQQSAMNEVARARERREANRVGEVEKRAVSEQIKAQQLAKRRSSMMDLRETGSGSQQHVASSSKHKRNSSATALAVPLPRPTSMHIPAPVSSSFQNDARRSRGTSHGLSHPQCSSKQQHLSPARPEAGRAKSGPPPVGEKRGRYHSFYEQRAASTSAPSFHSAHSHSHSNSNSSSNPKIHAHPHGFPQHGVSPYPHPHHAQAHAHMFAQAQGGLQVYPPAYQQHQGVSMYGGMTMPPVLGMPNHPYATQQGVYGSPASSKRVTRMA